MEQNAPLDYDPLLEKPKNAPLDYDPLLGNEAARGVEPAPLPAGKPVADPADHSWIGWLRHKAGMAANSVASGAINAADVLSRETPEEREVKRTAEAFAPEGKATSDPQKREYYNDAALTPGGALRNTLINAGVLNQKENLPQTSGEHFTDAVLQGLAGNALMPGGFVGGGLGGLGRAATPAIKLLSPTAVSSNIGGSVAGEAVRQAMHTEGQSDSFWGPFLASALGGFVGGATPQAVAQAGERSTARAAVGELEQKLADITQRKVYQPNELKAGNFAAQDEFAAAQAQHAAGADAAIAQSKKLKDDLIASAKQQIDSSKETMQDAISKAKATGAQTSEVSRDAAIAAAKAETAQRAGDLDSALEHIANAHGTSATLDEAGKYLQASARNFVTPKTGDLAARDTAAWAPVDAKLSPQTPVDPAGLARLTTATDELAGRGGAFAEAVRKLSPTLSPYLQKIFAKMEGNADELEKIGLTPEDHTPVTLRDIRQLNQAINEAKGKPAVLRETSPQELDTLGGITKDIAVATADAHGVGNEYLHALAVGRANREFASGPLASIVESHAPSSNPSFAPGTVLAKLLASAKNTGETLGALRADPAFQIPMNEVAGQIIRQAKTSPNVWNDLSPEAKIAIIPDAAHRNAFSTLLADKAGLAEGEKATVQSIKSAHDSGAVTPEVIAAAKTHADNVAKSKASIVAAQQAHLDEKAAIETSKTKALVLAKEQKDRVTRENSLAPGRLSEAEFATRQKLAEQQDIAGIPKTPANPLTAWGAPIAEAIGGAGLGYQAADLIGKIGVTPGVAALMGSVGIPLAAYAGKKIVRTPNVESFVAHGLTNPLLGK